ncbi:hypothetical protein BS78_03G196300 [Paspalum vaginatum]|nr:hypothetical protein BS78_03G196300 [Paspalum vaginatum]
MLLACVQNSPSSDEFNAVVGPNKDSKVDVDRNKSLDSTDACETTRAFEKHQHLTAACYGEVTERQAAAMEDEQALQLLVPRVKLGAQGLEVSKLGFGCFGLTGAYGTALDDEAAAAVIEHAFRRGVTFFDTSDIYGPHHANEILLGKLPREQVQVATKFGLTRDASGGGAWTPCGRPEYVRACCEASLRRLGVDCIDLYYQHRVDTTVPIEDTVGELKKLVEEGKVKYIGLSEASPDTIRRAHAVHPVAAVQMEWSLWSRDIEPQIVPLCRELGIGIVPYSPIGKGFFGGRGVTEQVSAESNLQRHPRFSAENLEKNRQIYLRMEELAKKNQCSPAQLALSWVLHQGDDVVPIPGTTKINNLDANIESLKVKLTDEDLKEIASQIREEDVAGARQNTSFAPTNWNYADTPRKQSC